MKTLKFIAFCAIIFAAAATESCKKEEAMGSMSGNTNGTGSTDMVGQRNGYYTVKMTDAPANFLELNVEIKKVEIYSEGSGWITLNNRSSVYNVLELSNGKEVSIASGFAGIVNTSTGANSRTALRIVFGSKNSITLKKGSATLRSVVLIAGSPAIELRIPDAIKANGNVLIDFNAAQSVIEEGTSFIMKPVISIIADPNTGIAGQVTNNIKASVSVFSAEGLVSTTFTDLNGMFKIKGLKSGTYDLEFQYDTNTIGEIISEKLTTVRLRGVHVVRGSMTETGTIDLETMAVGR